MKKEDNGTQAATFLDVNIKIKDSKFETKLYDKSDNFSFYIVRFPIRSSNMPTKMLYSTIRAEVFRRSRITNSLEDTFFSSYIIT